MPSSIDRKYPLPEIRNPNLQTQGPGGGGSGGDMRGTMAFALLMIVVLLGYQYFFAPKQATTPPATQTQSQPAQPAAQAAPSQPDHAQVSAGQAQAPAPTPTIAAALETETTVENELYKIVFTNHGAQVKHWILKKYTDTAGKPLDMVQPQAAARFGLPLSLFTYEPALTAQLNQALYQVSTEGAPPSPTGLVLAPNALIFHYAANGLDVVKTIRFDSTYVLNVEAEVKRNGQPVRALVQWPAGLGDMEEFLPSSATRASVRTSAASQFAWSLEGKQDSIAAKKVSGNDTITQPYSYAAITDLYFTAAFLPDNPESTTLVTLHNSIDLPSNLSDPNSQKSPADILGLAVGDTSGYTRLRLFAGPKAMDVVSSIHAIGADGKPTGQSLEPLIQFGWLTVIAKPLYLALRFLYEHGIPNWGWAIIVITVIFNVLMLPTRLMMMKSSLKMARLQPKIEALKKRYAHLKMNDPKKAEMNTEMMELYKTEGVNMYGGCLPMLIQMPLFFAYYRVLANVIELRQAHWFWLTDLSSPDPMYILPILIIISMFLVQFITPSPGMPPEQRRMMAIMMPAIFGFSMLHFASGLALYWGTGNLINLGIQLGINQSSIGKEMHAIAAKRAGKKNGGKPPTIQGKR
ncbi:MAG: membrane protein insertase YidC [Terracidiphilus sp.]|jgi:YidC/Oxa1 family membrane protein insertase